MLTEDIFLKAKVVKTSGAIDNLSPGSETYIATQIPKINENYQEEETKRTKLRFQINVDQSKILSTHNDMYSWGDTPWRR